LSGPSWPLPRQHTDMAIGDAKLSQTWPALSIDFAHPSVGAGEMNPRRDHRAPERPHGREGYCGEMHAHGWQRLRLRLNGVGGDGTHIMRMGRTGQRCWLGRRNFCCDHSKSAEVPCQSIRGRTRICGLQDHRVARAAVGWAPVWCWHHLQSSAASLSMRWSRGRLRSGT